MEVAGVEPAAVVRLRCFPTACGPNVARWQNGIPGVEPAPQASWIGGTAAGDVVGSGMVTMLAACVEMTEAKRF